MDGQPLDLDSDQYRTNPISPPTYARYIPFHLSTHSLFRNHPQKTQTAWPGECTGHFEQSPVNLIVATSEAVTDGAPLALAYTPVNAWTITNNGHTAQFTVDPAEQVCESFVRACVCVCLCRRVWPRQLELGLG